MTGQRNQPLAQRLTRRTIAVQQLTLAVFFGVVIFPIFVLPLLLGVRDTSPIDPRVLDVFERSLNFGAEGRFGVEPNEELLDLAERHPGIWFFAQDEDGQEASFGDVPDEMMALRPALSQIASLHITVGPERAQETLVVRTQMSEHGLLRMATGGGPHINPSLIVQIGSISIAAATLIVLALASAIAVPRLIRRDLRSLNAAAEAAEHIRIERGGDRIPEADLPAEVGVLVRAINRALERLDEAYWRRERFLAGTAHELRTPLAVLQTRIETAEPFPLQQQLLADVGRLTELTNQLLDLQRFTMASPELVRVDLCELASAAVADLAPLAIANGYELGLEGAERPIWILGDERSLRHAISNIVRNAISYGGNAGTIVVEVSPSGRLSVLDQGPGIPQAERDRIFEPFYRLTQGSEGAGLGLSLVQSIVAVHGGKLSIGASPSGGAAFTIEFQLAGEQ
ncbi:sensor histidine kinase [Devosia submarina]|uniref:sensor histidine kinase n=1 Tax=Devosia submarina TaxID=1173082 RepID=UPI000D3A3060|nr:HAMP domain-containing sensor histidine kinase [Devosia submarina]